MSTIKDVAKLAGVSLGTVSNVLNSNTAVNHEKARRVHEAIKELNYKPHQTARSLKTNRTMNAAVVLPDILDPMKSSLFTGIERVLSEQGYAVSLYITSEIPTKETAIIERILGQRADGIIIATCQPRNVGLFKQLKNHDTSVVLVDRAAEGSDFHLVEFDNYSTILSLTESVLQKTDNKIVIASGRKEYSSEAASINACLETCERLGHRLDDEQILTMNFNKESSFRVFTQYLQRFGVPDAVIATGTPLMHGIVKALDMQAVEKDKRPELYSLSEENWAESAGDEFVRLSRRPITLGETAAELLLEELNGSRPVDFKTIRIPNLSYSGQMKAVSGDFRKARETIKVLMLDSPAYRAIRDLTPDFEKKFGIKAEYTAMDYSKLSALMESVESRSKFDVFLVDIPWIPDLVQSGALLELSEFSSEVEEISKSFIPGVLSAYSEFDGGIYALPFMFGTQLLYYRKDLFEDGSLKLKYNEKYGYELKVPKTWAEFNQAAEFFTKSFNPESPVKFGTTLGGRETSGAVCEFLPRLWAYDGFFFSREGRVNPDRTAFIKALKVYKESYKYTDPGSPDFWWDEQLNEFRAGDAAMMIMFIAHASGLADTAGTKIAGKIGYDIIPGGCPLLGGWSIGINSSSSRPEESFSFISWAASKELAIPQTILGGSTASISLYKSSELLTIYPWLPKALESFKTSRKRDISRSTTMGRLSEKDFEQILGNAIHNVIKGETEPEEAADEVFHEILEGLSNTGG